MNFQEVINMFTDLLETPIKIGAGLIFVYGIFFDNGFKEDNPQAKSSAIKSMIAGGLLLVATQIGQIVGG